MTANGSASQPFDHAKAYKDWEVNGKYYGDGREPALLDFIYSHPDLERLRNNPAALLSAVDSFAREHTGLINIGESKGKIVTELIAKHKPVSMVEMGGYVGYSAIMFGAALRDAGGKKYYSVEKHPLFAAVASSLIDLAGLRDVVRVVVGTGAEGVQRLYDDGLLSSSETLGMLFFDHHKPSYTHDLKLCERLGLVGKGTVLVGDNMIIPGNPPYLEYVRASAQERREMAKGKPPNEVGNPDLEYTGSFVKSFEPSGMEDAMEISECSGVAP